MTWLQFSLWDGDWIKAETELVGTLFQHRATNLKFDYDIDLFNSH